MIRYLISFTFHVIFFHINKTHILPPRTIKGEGLMFSCVQNLYVILGKISCFVIVLVASFIPNNFTHGVCDFDSIYYIDC